MQKNTEKRKRQDDGKKKQEYERESKSYLRTLVLQDVGWQSQRGKGTEYRCFTLHGSGRIEDDNMEVWMERKLKLEGILSDLISRRKLITGAIIQIEFWKDEELQYKYLQLNGFHIHFVVDGLERKLIADQWMSFYEHFCKELFLSPLDYQIDSQFGMTSDRNYGLPYIVAYCFKRDRFHKPTCLGYFKDELIIKEILQQHKNNPIEYQVNYRKEYPHPSFDIEDTHKQSQLAITWWEYFFYKTGAKFDPINKFIYINNTA